MGVVKSLLKRSMRSDARPVVSSDTAQAANFDTLILGIGAQKSATTWLGDTLGRHPSIHIRRKEVHYWDYVRYPYTNRGTMGWKRDGTSIDPELFGADPFDNSNYLGFLGAGRGDKPICADITPAYALCQPATFAEMAHIHKDVRLIYIMRDPVDRLWSGIAQRLRPVLAGNPGFTGMERMFLEACSNPHDFDLLRSRYDTTLKVLETLGRPYLCMFYESMFTEESMKSLADFIGVDEIGADLGEVSYPSANKNVQLSDAARETAREVLDPTYAFVRERFGTAVPDAWMD